MIWINTTYPQIGLGFSQAGPSLPDGARAVLRHLAGMITVLIRQVEERRDCALVVRVLLALNDHFLFYY